MTSSDWATQQLAEFLAVLTTAADENLAVDNALERLAESFDADGGAFVRGRHVVSSLGWSTGHAHEASVLAVALGHRTNVEIPGAGVCETVVIPVDRDEGSKVVLARALYRFSAEESALLRGVGRVLALALRLLRTVAVERRQAGENAKLVSSLRERQALLERLSSIQRQISSRALLPEVLHAVTAGVAEFLGDDFVVMQLIDEPDPGCTMTASCAGDALVVAKRVLELLEEPFDIDGMVMPVEASCGVAIAPEDGDSADLLLQRADVAMYVAKDSHASIVTYNDELNINTPARLALLSELRAAVSRGQFVLYYQPKAALGARSVHGVEALVRWQHPTYGLVPPNDFIPLAEHTGLIKPLTSWVLNAALEQLSRWRQMPDSPALANLSVAVNVSTRSLLDDDFPTEVADALERWNVPQNLPVNELKIDRSFVYHMHCDPNDAVIVQSVIDLGRNLGLHTVAEGIEDDETWEHLRRLGCDSGQGYLLARPMPAESLVIWLSEMDARTA